MQMDITANVWLSNVEATTKMAPNFKLHWQRQNQEGPKGAEHPPCMWRVHRQGTFSPLSFACTCTR